MKTSAQVPIIELTTYRLSCQAYMGDKVFINGKRKSFRQLRNMKSKKHLCSVEHEGAINVLRTIKP